MADPAGVVADPWGTVKLVAAIASPIVSIVAMGVSAFIAWTAIKTPQKDRESKNHLDQAILSLQRAHAALTDDGRSEHAQADRMNWLTAARHIETYKVLKNGVTEPSHKVLCEDHEEYWRHRIYLAIDMHNIHQSSWYDENRAIRKSCLSPASLLIVYGFATWPEDKEDPIDLADLEAIAKQHDVRKGNVGLGLYLEKSPKITAMLDKADAERRARQP